MSALVRFGQLVGGKQRAQPVFRALHRISLVGRNYGQTDIARSGELGAMRRVAAKLPNASTIFDVGANVGDWSLAAVAQWPQATIYAFEPAKATYDELVAATASHNVRGVQAALSDSEGTLTLHSVPGRTSLSSLHKRDLSEYGMEMTLTEEVAVFTLDQYCADQHISRIDFLKVDAEGHDLSVLKGAAGLLDSGSISFIQFEFGGSNIDSRTFLRDFVELLTPRYMIYRLLANGVEPLNYREREEIFRATNFLAELS